MSRRRTPRSARPTCPVPDCTGNGFEHPCTSTYQGPVDIYIGRPCSYDQHDGAHRHVCTGTTEDGYPGPDVAWS